jgi:hypothetical protein
MCEPKKLHGSSLISFCCLKMSLMYITWSLLGLIALCLLLCSSFLNDIWYEKVNVELKNYITSANWV